MIALLLFLILCCLLFGEDKIDSMLFTMFIMVLVFVLLSQLYALIGWYCIAVFAIIVLIIIW